MRSYLGIDCGSVSIKFALIEDGRTAAKVYLRNTGLISTIKEGLKELPGVEISGVGVTGSGKEFVRNMIGADYIDSEIISHVVACLKQFPRVRTILDIGGEDSKLMLVRSGTLAGFQMNRDCGGGTGAMIESIAARLHLRIEEFGEIALRSKNPVMLPGKCGIFCQSAVVSEINKGRHMTDILMGVCQALVGNYLAVLAKGKKLLSPIVFQGATAQNIALVKCFSEALNKTIHVPEDCGFMGAIGIADMTREAMGDCDKSKFHGIEQIISADYRTETTYCGDCENRCEILGLYCNGEIISKSGSRCGKNNL